MATSVVPAVIDYLYNTFTASSTLGGAAAPGTVVVYDGPVSSEATSPLTLWVGLDDPDATAATKAADSTSDWAGLGAQHRNESIVVYCCADAYTGLDDARTARVLAYQITAAVETIIRADGTLGGTVTVPGNASVSVMGLLQKNTGGPSGGALARVTFAITAKARI